MTFGGKFENRPHGDQKEPDSAWRKDVVGGDGVEIMFGSPRVGSNCLHIANFIGTHVNGVLSEYESQFLRAIVYELGLEVQDFNFETVDLTIELGLLFLAAHDHRE